VSWKDRWCEAVAEFNGLDHEAKEVAFAIRRYSDSRYDKWLSHKPSDPRIHVAADGRDSSGSRRQAPATRLDIDGMPPGERPASPISE